LTQQQQGNVRFFSLFLLPGAAGAGRLFLVAPSREALPLKTYILVAVAAGLVAYLYLVRASAPRLPGQGQGEGLRR
jgi:hypothetical protein